MKYLPIIFLLVSFNTFAQYNDGDDSIGCKTDEHCLVNDQVGFIIKIIPIENRRGEIVGEKLSSHSALSDTVYPGASLCFKGEAQQVCKILEMMVGQEEANYYGGGHSLITKFSCDENEGRLMLQFTVKHDMAPKLEAHEFYIPHCL
jgi:hypothetical protein